MKKLQIEEWTTTDGRKLVRRLSADQYEVNVYSCTGAELAELGAAIADALTLQPTAPPRETVEFPAAVDPVAAIERRNQCPPNPQ